MRDFPWQRLMIRFSIAMIDFQKVVTFFGPYKSHLGWSIGQHPRDGISLSTWSCQNRGVHPIIGQFQIYPNIILLVVYSPWSFIIYLCMISSLSRYIPSYPIISHHIPSYPITSYHILSYPAKPKVFRQPHSLSLSAPARSFANLPFGAPLLWLQSGKKKCCWTNPKGSFEQMRIGHSLGTLKYVEMIELVLPQCLTSWFQDSFCVHFCFKLRSQAAFTLLTWATQLEYVHS